MYLYILSQVFAASRQDLDDVESRIKTLVKEKLRKEEIHQEAIGNLSDSQIQRIMCLQTTHDTKIQIDKKVGRIVVRGASEDVYIVKIGELIVIKVVHSSQHNTLAPVLKPTVQTVPLLQYARC